MTRGLYYTPECELQRVERDCGGAGVEKDCKWGRELEKDCKWGRE